MREINLIVSFLVALSFVITSCNDSLKIECERSTNIEYPFIAHSHNDYQKNIPISHAFEYGFTSFEVDIVFYNEQIIVSHDINNLKDKPLFETDYLVPLIEVGGEKSMILLIDIKNYSQQLLDKLHEILIQCEDHIVNRTNSNKELNKIKIILSGDIPRMKISKEDKYKFFFLDGRFSIEDLRSDSDIMPLISLNMNYFQGNNITNQLVIEEVIREIHKTGKLVRFWNTQNHESVWLTLINNNVNIIGVDDIDNFYCVMKANGLTQ